MKYIGIDFGKKRIGLAVSNEEGTLAFPLRTLENNSDVISELVSLVSKESITSIVMGKSLNAQGTENLIQRDIRILCSKIKDQLPDLAIFHQDERGSSIAAAAHLYGKDNIANKKWTAKANAKKREHNDAHAATIILQRFLDKEVSFKKAN